jgi:hypothetical protein
MKISESYSHLNGLEFLLVHKPRLWEETQNVIISMDAEKCKTKVSREKTMEGRLLYSPIDINKRFKEFFSGHGWRESRVSYWVTSDDKLIRKTLTLDADQQKKEIEAAGYTPIFSYTQNRHKLNIQSPLSLRERVRARAFKKFNLWRHKVYNQTDFIKDRVAVEVRFGKYSFVAYDLFVKHLAFFVGDKIDVGIEILPMKSLQAQMSSGVAYYEGELYNVIRQGRGVPAVPLVIFGITT